MPTIDRPRVLRARRAGGSLRVCRPEATLGPATELFRAVGGTRIADVTGLDRIGIPVVMAVRPNSRSLSVSQGKGPTMVEAKVSAVMESIELWHAERTRRPDRFASPAELADGAVRVVEVELLPRRDWAALRHDRQVPWLHGRTVLTEEPVAIPLEVIDLDYVARKPYPHLGLLGGSNGLASGNTMDEAVVHGLYELVERDAESSWWSMTVEEQRERRIDPSTITDPVADALLDRLDAAGVELALWDLTGDVGVAVVRAVLVDRTTRSLVPIAAARGSGCHHDRDVALVRAVTEAAQSRLTAIVGARDDIDPGGFSTRRRPQVNEGLLAAFAAEPLSRPMDALPSSSERDLGRLIADLVARLGALGFPEPAVADLTVPGSWGAVARVVAPGLAGVPSPLFPIGRPTRTHP